MVRNSDGSRSRISPYTLLAANDDFSGTNTASSFVAEEPQQSNIVGKKSLQPPDNDTPPGTGSSLPVDSIAKDVSADSPYVPMPVAGSNLPISPYSCIEQTTNDSPLTAEPSLQTGADVRPQDAVIGGTEGTKCDGYIPWSSTQPSL